MAQTCQVAIVGGGPVGLGLALDLGLRGISCVLLERRTQPHNIPKGQNLTQRTLEIFHFWGISDQIRKARLIPSDYPGNFIVTYGDLMSPYWYVPAPRETMDRYFFQKGERLPQYLTEEILARRLADFPSVCTRPGWSMESFSSEGLGSRSTPSMSIPANRTRYVRNTSSDVTAADPGFEPASGFHPAARITGRPWCSLCFVLALCMTV